MSLRDNYQKNYQLVWWMMLKTDARRFGSNVRLFLSRVLMRLAFLWCFMSIRMIKTCNLTSVEPVLFPLFESSECIKHTHSEFKNLAFFKIIQRTDNSFKKDSCGFGFSLIASVGSCSKVFFFACAFRFLKFVS